MSTEMPAAFAREAAEAADEAQAATSEWIETALAVLFTAAIVLFASFLAVVNGLV
jgi:uncharacterized membrane protein